VGEIHIVTCAVRF